MSFVSTVASSAQSHDSLSRGWDRAANRLNVAGDRHAPAQPAPDELHCHLSDLYANQTRWRFTSGRDRIELLERGLASVAAAAPQWVDVACEIKHIPTNDPCRAEEVLSGPVIAMRHLRLLLRNERRREFRNLPPLPDRLSKGPTGRWRVPTIPITRELFDPICFVNFRGHVELRSGLSEDEARAATQSLEEPFPATSLILGAGNVTGILAADILGTTFSNRHVALVKLHPLMDPLRPVLDEAFAPLIDAGVLRLISGGPEIGRRAVTHDLVDHVHLTGSVAAHESIVWGEADPERDVRRSQNEPLLDKPITSELGNVTPWIVVPGNYSSDQLQAQAENLAASITNNAGFNCLSTRVLVTCPSWPQREEFLSRLQAILAKLPRRVAYYPGAVERFERFTRCRLSGSTWESPRNSAAERSCRISRGDKPPRLPWTLFRDVDPHEAPLYCREESFVPICAEMPLDADHEFTFLDRATDFVNEQLWGTLCTTLTVPNELRRSARGQAELAAVVTRLRYGTVCLNQWPGLAFAMLTLPWGGYPGGTLLDPQSGLGWVHNTFGLRAIEKSVLDGPLTVTPKPIWVPGHPQPERIAWKFFQLYHRPSLWSVADLAYSACAAAF